MVNKYILVLLFANFFFSPGGVAADTHYFRNFERDPSGVNDWFKFGGEGSGGLSEGGLALNGSNAWFLNETGTEFTFQEASIRTQIAFEGDSNGFGIFSNGDLELARAYQAGYNPDAGRLYVGWNNPAYNGFEVKEVDFDVKAGEEIILQFDVFQNILALSAWRPGEEKPNVPQIGFVDENVQLGPGIPGVSFDATGTSTATYRFYRVDDEPISQIENCDFDHSGDCLLFDLDTLLYRGLDAQSREFDLNNSGIVDEIDITTWLALSGDKTIGRAFLAGDLNLDGNVNATDLNLLALNWNARVNSWSEGDINGDYNVSASDLNSLALNWQSAPAAVKAPVPEPASLPTIAIAGLVYFATRRMH